MKYLITMKDGTFAMMQTDQDPARSILKWTQADQDNVKDYRLATAEDEEMFLIKRKLKGD